MVEENLMYKDASDRQTLEDLRAADASLRALATKLTAEAAPETPADPKDIAEAVTKCRELLSPAIGKLRGGMPKAPTHAKANNA